MLLKTVFVHHKTSLRNCNPPEMSYHTHYTPGNMVSSGDQPCVSLCNFGIILHCFLFSPLQTSQLPQPLPLTFYSLLLTKALSSLSPEHFVTFIGRCPLHSASQHCRLPSSTLLHFFMLVLTSSSVLLFSVGGLKVLPSWFVDSCAMHFDE